MNYEELELRVGLEIHQQLDTKKLFCNCESNLYDSYKAEVIRALRPTQSELGDLDKAALEEARKGLRFKYQATENTCLVELDEEPPHKPNPEAIKIALMVAKLLNAKPIDEINFMRKIVIDGSNTAGFQRTALLATDGKIDQVKIQTICLEEDAARKIEQKEGFVVYRLDRLGIPLVELATYPILTTPELAKAIAEKLGLLLRAIKKVKRGLGTIRQDLNVSIKGGARVEIKGVQDLSAIPKVIELEVKRQLWLLGLKNKLAARNIRKPGFEIFECSELFKATACKLFQNMLKEGKPIFGLKLEGFAGLLAGPKETRLGRELAGVVKYLGIKGIIHSDEELSQYGISAEELVRIKQRLALGAQDAWVLVGGAEKTAREALTRILERAEQCLLGVPKEVRRALPDNTTEYMRPMPGEARLYPETDVQPIKIEPQLKRIKLPELPEKKLNRFCKDYKISLEQAKQIIRQGYDDLYEKFVEKYAPSVVARTFLSTIPELERQGLDTTKITEEFLSSVFEALAQKKFAKEAIPEIISCMLKENISVMKAAEYTGLGLLTYEELEKIIEKVLSSRKELVKQKGEKAFAPLMGLVMSQVRGKFDGKLVASILKKKLKSVY